jgi:predicted Zn-ribbon and HTH transcriptional regulator
MGHEYLAKCNRCSFKFNVSEGGGKVVHLLRCDTCGKDKWIRFREIGEPHFHYIKELDRPYCASSSASDENIQKCYPGKPITREEYFAKVEEIVGDCECGGIYKFNALPRCPKCNSTDIEDTEELVAYYD